MLEASVRVYDRMPAPETERVSRKILFVQVDEDHPGMILTSLGLEVDTWELMGKPEQLTVTIVPGDQVNEPANRAGRLEVKP